MNLRPEQLAEFLPKAGIVLNSLAIVSGAVYLFARLAGKEDLAVLVQVACVAIAPFAAGLTVADAAMIYNMSQSGEPLFESGRYDRSDRVINLLLSALALATTAAALKY